MLPQQVWSQVHTSRNKLINKQEKIMYGRMTPHRSETNSIVDTLAYVILW